MKLPCRVEEIKSQMINQKMLENQIEELETTRSCPTGYFDCELKSTATLELLYLRKSLYEYLKLKSRKTRNLQFIHLIKRINKELKSRKVEIPICDMEYANSLKDFDEISIYLNSSLSSYEGEYCYLARKQSNSLSKDQYVENFIISTNYFSFSSFLPNTAIPNFIQDINYNNSKPENDDDQILELKSDSSEKEAKIYTEPRYSVTSTQ